MRSVCLAAELLIPLVLVAQVAKRPFLSSHDRFDGPFGGEYHVKDLQIFADGKVQYVEEYPTLDFFKTTGDMQSPFDAQWVADRLYLSKATDWKYEKEWRLLAFVGPHRRQPRARPLPRPQRMITFRPCPWHSQLD